MMHSLEELDFFDDTSLPLLIREDLILVVDLHRHSVPSRLMKGFLNNGICPLAEDLAKAVVPN
jgi:hypothetical protein